MEREERMYKSHLARKKRKEDPNPNRRGKAKNVKTKKVQKMI